MQTIQVNNHKVLWLDENSLGPNYIYSYSKSHSYSRSDFGPAEAAGRSQTRPVEYSLNAIQGNSEILCLYENSMGPNYIYSYSKSHSYSRSDFGPVP